MPNSCNFPDATKIGSQTESWEKQEGESWKKY